MLACHKQQSVETIEVAAIGIAETADDQRHVGLLYRNDRGELRACHLAWHFLLKDEKAEETGGFRFDWVVTTLPSIVLKNVAAYAQMIVDANKPSDIPYSFLGQDNAIDPESGEYNPSSPGEGLTCATFILHIFKNVSLPLLVEDSYEKRAEDLDWQKKIIELLRSRASPAHIEKLEQSELAIRFRPEEVAAASARRLPPVHFKTAERIGIELVEELQKCCPCSGGS